MGVELRRCDGGGAGEVARSAGDPSEGEPRMAKLPRAEFAR